jgi:hypothetical protein
MPEMVTWGSRERMVKPATELTVPVFFVPNFFARESFQDRKNDSSGFSVNHRGGAEGAE